MDRGLGLELLLRRGSFLSHGGESQEEKYSIPGFGPKCCRWNSRVRVPSEKGGGQYKCPREASQERGTVLCCEGRMITESVGRSKALVQS